MIVGLCWDITSILWLNIPESRVGVGESCFGLWYLVRRYGSGFSADYLIIERVMKYFLLFLFALVISALLVVTYGSIEAVGNEN
jgi:hypothetical protein